MDQPKKSNPLAAISFACGLIALISMGLIFLAYSLLEQTESLLFITDGILMPVRNISGVAAIITGILAHLEIRKKGHTEKGKWLAWGGIILGAAWILFGMCVGLVFLVSTLSQVW
jgi:hypothetical protein